MSAEGDPLIRKNISTMERLVYCRYTADSRQIPLLCNSCGPRMALPCPTLCQNKRPEPDKLKSLITANLSTLFSTKPHLAVTVSLVCPSMYVRRALLYSILCSVNFMMLLPCQNMEFIASETCVPGPLPLKMASE